jgi:diguanylate cyclase (GGDEF)-like protein/PAS domain S-box-containing protein
LYRVPTDRSQPRAARPTALVVSDSALERHLLPRRLGGADVQVLRSVDPWHAEGELGRAGWDVMVWACPRLEGVARELALRPGAPPVVLVLEARAPAARAAAALRAGMADVHRGPADPELAARVGAVAARGRRAREAWEGAEAFRALAEGSRDMLARHAPDGPILYASDAAREILGRAPAALRGRRWLDLCHPDDRTRAAAALEAAADAPAATRPLRHRSLHADGGWVWMETAVRALRDPTGRLRELHTDSRDVSERVRAEVAREALARVTAAVAGGAGVAEVCALVAREAAAGGDEAAVVRLHGDEGVVLGAAGPGPRLGDRIPVAAAARGDAVAAVVLDGVPWGLVTARGGRPDPARLRSLADLVALAVTNAHATERLVALATTDPLTGLANHRAFQERLAAEVSRARRAGEPLALVMIDLDHFKRVNDTHGHQAGDEVLREVARRLMACARREDLCARVGGEELAWLLPATGADAAMAAAERLRAAIAGTPIPPAGRQTASLGVAGLGPGGAAALVRDADAALYRAKAAGRDACVAAGPPTAARSARAGGSPATRRAP